jgi:hypothetical protein
MKKTCLILSLACAVLTPLPGASERKPFADIPVHKQSDIQYVTGGSTDAERQEMRRIANKYPMQLEFTVGEERPDLTGVKVTVKNLKGDKLIEAVSSGPYFFFNPPSGRWTMDAEYNGETISKTVDLVGRRYIVLEFRFKAPG